MRAKLVGIAILTLLAVKALILISGVGIAQEIDPAKEMLIREIMVYRDAVDRILDVVGNESGVAQEASTYIRQLDGMDLASLTVDELRGIRDTLKNYFDQLKEMVETDSKLEKELKKRILEEVMAVLDLIAQKYNASNIQELYGMIANSVASGDIDTAVAMLSDISKALNELSVDYESRKIVDDIMKLLNSLSRDGNATSTSDIAESIDRIAKAMSILEDVKEYMKSINASQEAILALDLAISMLNSTVTVLNNVVQQVGNNTVPGVVGQTLNNTMADKILKEISEERFKVERLFNESNRLENISISQNKTYLIDLINKARDALSNASKYLDMAENATLGGNFTEALNLLNKAKVQREYAENILEDVAKILGVELSKEEAKPSQPATYLTNLQGKLADLQNDIYEKKVRAQNMLNNPAIAANNVSYALITKALQYLDNASKYVNMSWTYLNEGNYSMALDAYFQAKKYYEMAEINIEIVHEWMGEEEHKDIVSQILDQMYELQEKILKESARADYLYNVAVDKNDSYSASLILEAREKLNNASALLSTIPSLIADGNYTQAVEVLNNAQALIMDAKQLLTQAENSLGVTYQGGEEGGYEDSTGEHGSSEDHGGSEDHSGEGSGQNGGQGGGSGGEDSGHSEGSGNGGHEDSHGEGDHEGEE